MQGLRLYLRRTERPARAGGEKLKKKEKTTMSIDGGPAVPFPSKAAEKEIEKAVKPIVQTNLHGGEVPVETDYETKEYVLISSEKLFVRFSEESLDKTLGLKEAETKKAILRKIRIKAEKELMPGEWDRQSKLLVEAARKGF